MDHESVGRSPQDSSAEEQTPLLSLSSSFPGRSNPSLLQRSHDGSWNGTQLIPPLHHTTTNPSGLEGTTTTTTTFGDTNTLAPLEGYLSHSWRDAIHTNKKEPYDKSLVQDEEDLEPGGGRRRRPRLRPRSPSTQQSFFSLWSSGCSWCWSHSQRVSRVLIYAAINLLLAVPGLYGYAAVIFNHAVFRPYTNALAKLVLWSSLVHQAGFLCCSSLSGFAIGTVQDAGLVFLSRMSHDIATQMTLRYQRDDSYFVHALEPPQGLSTNDTNDSSSSSSIILDQAIVSTTVVLLSLSTALLGVCLVLMGHFRLAHGTVSYLPMPVVGGYLAFIGYFCVQAGVALAISTPLVTLRDWVTQVLLRTDHLLLALPACVAGLVLTWVARTGHATGQASLLPACMVAIPALFYVIVFLHYRWTTHDADKESSSSSSFLDTARTHGWVGPVAPPTPVSDLVQLIHWQWIDWSMISHIGGTWVGMVLVVSFASCLDVAAIAMDMGRPLDTNRELRTVGICNGTYCTWRPSRKKSTTKQERFPNLHHELFLLAVRPISAFENRTITVMSGLTVGFTGSYIFSQTIFTYRTGVHTRWIGICIMALYLFFVLSPLNLLEWSPLFFLGSTLIFIGYDLLYEWLIEIRDRILWFEYALIWGTFVAIQIVGVDVGILVGVVSAMVEQALSTAQTTTVLCVPKRSKAVWSREEMQLLHRHVYQQNDSTRPIVTLELMGPVFFGSALYLMERLLHEVGLSTALDHGNNHNNTKERIQSNGNDTRTDNGPFKGSPAIPHSPRTSPYFVALNKRPSLFHQDVASTVSHGPNHRTTTSGGSIPRRSPPKYCVLDLTQVSNMDASSARSCFVQFAKLCSQEGITVCASGATPRIAWMLRTHQAAYPLQEEEERIKATLWHVTKTCSTTTSSKSLQSPTFQHPKVDKILLFHTTHEALEFCEASLIHEFQSQSTSLSQTSSTVMSASLGSGKDTTLSSILGRFLLAGSIATGYSPEELLIILQRLDSQRYHSELEYQAGEKIMAQDTRPESFYVVLEGAVASGAATPESVQRHRQPIVSGAGPVHLTQSSSFTNLLDALPLAFGGRGQDGAEFTATTTTTANPTGIPPPRQPFHPHAGSSGGGSSGGAYHPPVVVGTVWPLGGVFGFTDLWLDRPRTFGAFATQDPTRVARITRSHMNLLQQEDAQLFGLLHQVLLRSSILDLANCTCHGV